MLQGFMSRMDTLKEERKISKKDMETLKRHQVESLELKNTVSENFLKTIHKIKRWLNGGGSRKIITDLNTNT